MFEYYIANKSLIIKINGNLLGKSEEIKIQDLALCFCSKVCRNAILDLKGLNLINSMGVNLLLKILTKYRSEGGEMLIVKPQEKVSRLLATTKLDKIFIIKPSAWLALTELNAESS